MPSTKRPRFGSLQFWPRKKAKKSYARVKAWSNVKEPKPLAFLGYKVGMVHVMALNNNKNSHLKGEEVSVPATLIECPPMRILSARFYNYENRALQVKKEIFFKTEKILKKKIKVSKENSKDLDQINPDDYDVITMLVYTQPNKAGFGKKKPEVVEIGLGGTNSEKVEFLKQNSNKELDSKSIFEENQFVDIHAITKGKGYQGPVKRFGIGLKNHKSEKGVRTPGSLGPWNRHQHIMWKVSHAGQTGFHQRVEYNKQILEMSDDSEKRGKDFHKYGNLKSSYILLHGSIAGSKKRAILMTAPIREKDKKHQLTIQ